MSVLSIEDLSDAILPRKAPHGDVAMITAYFDDSGSDPGSPVVVYGGFIGSKPQWIGLEKAWQRRLNEPLPGKPPLKRFHMAPCMAQKGKDFGTYSRDDATRLAGEFIKIILDSGVYGYGCAVVKKDWDELIMGDTRRFLGDAERYTVTNCMMKAIQRARKFSFEKHIALVFDNRPHREQENRLVFDVFQKVVKHGIEKRPVPTIAFSSSTEFLPLQAADVIAWELFQRGKDIITKGFESELRGNLSLFKEANKIHGQIAGRESIQKIASYFANVEHANLPSMADYLEQVGRFS